MYKRRFKQWDLPPKYCNPGDIAEIERQRGAGGNRDVFTLASGREVPSSRAVRYYRRKTSPSTSQHRANNNGVTTKPLSLHVAPLIAPTISASSQAEDLLRAIKRYHDGVSPNFIWYENNQDRLCISREAGVDGRFRLSLFHDRMIVAINNMDKNDTSKLTKSREVMDGCMAEMNDILSDQDPFLIANLFHILIQIQNCQLPDDGRALLERIIVEYGRCVSARELGETHPLTIVWEILEKQLAEGKRVTEPTKRPCKKSIETTMEKSELFARVLELVLDEFQAHVGTNHAGSLIMRLHLHSSQGSMEWKQALVGLLAILERGRAPDRGFSRLKWFLLDDSISQERITRATKFICRLLRARLIHPVEGGGGAEDDGDPDLEAELVQCLSPAPTTEADYLP